MFNARVQDCHRPEGTMNVAMLYNTQPLNNSHLCSLTKILTAKIMVESMPLILKMHPPTAYMYQCVVSNQWIT